MELAAKNIILFGFCDPISSWSHLLGAVVFLILSYPLFKKAKGSPSRIVALAIYTFSLVFLFSMSGVYHLLSYDGEARPVLQRLDHAAIWVLIAGTFTPIHVILFRGPWRWLILLIVWFIAITGLTLQVIFFTSFPEWLVLSLFLGLGWIGALTGYKFRKSFHGESLRLLASGGIYYSIGAVLDFLKWPIIIPLVLGAHEIFHFFVIAGAIAHWRFIYNWADHPVANTISFQVKIFPNGSCLADAQSEHIKTEASNLDLLKEKIRILVREKYHESIEPKIHLKYSNEEYLD